MGLYYRPESSLSSSGATVLAFCPSGKLLAGGGAAPNHVSLWSTMNGHEKYHIDTRASAVTCISWSSSTWLQCGLENGYLLSVSLHDESQTLHVQGVCAHMSAVSCVSPHSSGRHLATAACDEVRIWERTGAQWQLVDQLDSPPTTANTRNLAVTVVSLAWGFESLDDDSYLLVSYRHHGIICWSLEERFALWVLYVGDPIVSTVLSPTACLSRIVTSCQGCLAVTTIHGDFDLYDLRTHLPVTGNISNVQDNSACSGAVTFAHNGKSLVGGTNSGIILLWDIENGINFQSLRHGALSIYIFGMGEATESACLTDSGRVLAVSAHYDSTTDTFRLATAADGSDVVLWHAVEIDNSKASSIAPSSFLCTSLSLHLAILGMAIGIFMIIIQHYLAIA